MSSKQGPTGARILYTAGAQLDVFIMDDEGTDVLQLTTTDSYDYDPAWAPDGKRVLYSSNAETGQFAIYIMNADGTGVTRLTTPPSPSDDRHPQALGPYIVFGRDDFLGGTHVIWRMNDDGSDLTRLTSGPVDREPAPSPGGKLVAFVRSADLYVVDVATHAITRLTNTAAIELNPAWSPGGKQIAFARLDAGSLYPDLFVMNADGTQVTQLTDTPTTAETKPKWSPDGKRVAFNAPAPTGALGIWVMDADGSNLNLVTPNDAVYHALGAWAR